MEQSNIQIKVPVHVAYAALEGAARAKMVGEYITQKESSGEEARYAQILGVSIFSSRVKTYDITLALRVNVLRTLFKRENVDLYIHAALAYDNDRQLLFLSRYNLDVRTQSTFYNAGLEVLANTIASKKILGKSKFDLKEIIGREVQKVNGLLETGLEVKGVVLKGAVASVSVQDFFTAQDKISLEVLMSGDVTVEVSDILSLIPQETGQPKVE